MLEAPSPVSRGSSTRPPAPAGVTTSSLRRLLGSLDYAHAAALLAPPERSPPTAGARGADPIEAPVPDGEDQKLLHAPPTSSTAADPELHDIVRSLVAAAPTPEPVAPTSPQAPPPATPATPAEDDSLAEVERAAAEPVELPPPEPTPTAPASTPDPTVTAALRYNLGRNYRPQVVMRIQEALGLPRTGRFDATTITAIRTFQRARGLPADGRVGPATLGHVVAVLRLRHGLRDQLTDAERSSAVTWNQQQRLDVALVKRLQAKLGVAADGIFGVETVQAVARFQATHHLAASGHLGPTTIAALRASHATQASGGGHFSLGELRCKDGSPTPARVVPNLLTLIEQLEVLRAAFGGATIRINSGYRSPTHNRRVGGERNSFHMRGMAADIVVAGRSPRVVHRTIERLIAAGRMRQGGLGLYGSFVHYDIRGYRARW